MNDLDADEFRRVARELITATERDPATECLIWKGGLSPKGYGRLWTGKRDVRASRAAWIVCNGPIPDGLLICHTCDRPACVEPGHLFLGSTEDNMADMVAKNRQARGVGNGKSKLTTSDVIRIYTTSRNTKAIAEMYGVSETQVRDIRRGVIWQHVTAAIPFKPLRYPGRNKPTPPRTGGGG